jgi:hypothetical protein
MKTQIVIPTKGRVKNMKTILGLFPTALITMDQSQAHLFRGIVPKKQILPHPDMMLIETRNWILDNVQADTVIQFNDDVVTLQRLVGGGKTYRDPKVIKAVVDNTSQCCTDLGLGVFGWSLTCNSSLLRPEIKPFRASAPISAHAFGVTGPARDRRLDTTFRGCGDFDYTLESLLHDRAIFCDCRWHFNCGGMSRGIGGQTGQITSEVLDEAQLDLRRKWGHYVGKSAARQVSKKNTWREFSVNVQRTSPLGLS